MSVKDCRAAEPQSRAGCGHPQTPRLNCLRPLQNHPARNSSFGNTWCTVIWTMGALVSSTGESVVFVVLPRRQMMTCRLATPRLLCRNIGIRLMLLTFQQPQLLQPLKKDRDAGSQACATFHVCCTALRAEAWLVQSGVIGFPTHNPVAAEGTSCMVS